MKSKKLVSGSKSGKAVKSSPYAASSPYATSSSAPSSTMSSSLSPNRVRVYNAGGGQGRTGLTFEALKAEQDATFNRSLAMPPLVRADREQTLRQITTDPKPVELQINIAREDFLNVEAWFDVSYSKAAAQASWSVLLNDVSSKLGLQFIEVLLDRKDGSQVHCCASLRPGGHYLARQRESSSILETIYTGKSPDQVHWPLTEVITTLKRDLDEDVEKHDALEERIDKLIKKPLVCRVERDAARTILGTLYPDKVIQTVKDAIAEIETKKKAAAEAATMRRSRGGSEAASGVNSARRSGTSSINGTRPTSPMGSDAGAASTAEAAAAALLSSTAAAAPLPYKENELDLVNLHRLALEALNRIALQGHWAAKEVASIGLGYIFTTVLDFVNEVDIVVVGLKLVSELLHDFNSYKYVIFKLTLDCIEAYAPPAPSHRPRPVPKSRVLLANLVSAAMTLIESNNSGALPSKKSDTSGPEESKVEGEGEGGAEAKADEAAGTRGTTRARNQQTVTPNISGLMNSTSRSTSKQRSASLQGVESGTNSAGPNQLGIKNRNASIQGSRPVGGDVSVSLTSVPLPAISEHGTSSDRPKSSSRITSQSLPAIGSVEAQSDSSQCADDTYGAQVAAENSEVETESTKLNRGLRSVNTTKKAWKGSTGSLGKKYVDESTLEYQLNLLALESPGGTTFGTGRRSPSNPDLIEPDPAAEMKALGMGTLVDITNPDINPHLNKGKYFRGFLGKMKRNMALLQSFSTLFKLVNRSPKNKDFSHAIALPDEICHIALVCQSIPQVLEYVMWIINTMYQELIIEEDYEDDLVSDSYTMILSKSGVFGKTRASAIPPLPSTKHSLGRKVIPGPSPLPPTLQQEEGSDSVGTSRVSADADDESESVVRSDEASQAGDPPPLLGAQGFIGPPRDDLSDELMDELSKEFAENNELNGPDISEGRDVNNNQGAGKDSLVVGEAEGSVDGSVGEYTATTIASMPLLEGVELDAMSEITAPSLASLQDFVSPRVCLDGQVEGGGETARKPRNYANLKDLKEELQEDIEGQTASVVFEDKRQIAKRVGEKLEPKPNPAMKMPADVVIKAVSMISVHTEIGNKEKSMATRWLTVWDDGSAQYQKLVREGLTLSAL